MECPDGADTRVSVPFHPVPRWRGSLAAAPSHLGGGIVRLSFALPSADFVATPHFLLCREPSVAEGRHFPVLGQAAGSLDIEASASELAGLGAGAFFEILPAWTLDLLFPPGQQTTFHLSSGRLATGRGSELLLFNRESAGTLLAPSRRFYLTAEGWFEVGGYDAAGDVVIPPGEPFLIRHPEGSGATSFTASQQVYESGIQLALRRTEGRRQDTTVAPPRPVAVALADLGLTPAQFEESLGTDPETRRDELLVFDNAAPGINKAPSAVYFRVGGQWIEDAPGFPAADGSLIEPWAGLLFRKGSGSDDFLVPWLSPPSYAPGAP